MRVTETIFERATRTDRWREVSSEVVAEGEKAETYWKSVLAAGPFFKAMGGYERRVSNVLTAIAPDRLSKSVYVYN